MINVVQAFILAAVVVIMAAYRPNGARFRPGVSALSGLLMGSCSALAVAFYCGRLEAGAVSVALSTLLLTRAFYCRGDSVRLLKLRR